MIVPASLVSEINEPVNDGVDEESSFVRGAQNDADESWKQEELSSTRKTYDIVSQFGIPHSPHIMAAYNRTMY